LSFNLRINIVVKVLEAQRATENAILCIPDGPQLHEVAPAAVGVIEDSDHDMPNIAMASDHGY
jgi:hypothetical protein